MKPATLFNWRNCLDKWLLPNLRPLPLASVNNDALKTLVAKMQRASLSPKTINNYVGLVKLVVGSALDEDGEQLFTRKWNHDLIDLPVIEDQHQPIFTPDAIRAIVAQASGQERILYALLARTGLRVGEALGLETGDLSDRASTPNTAFCEQNGSSTFTNQPSAPIIAPDTCKHWVAKAGFHTMRRFRVTWLRKNAVPR